MRREAVAAVRSSSAKTIRSMPAKRRIELVQELSDRGLAAILVDWSPDGSGLASKLGLSRTPGISELLAGAAKFEDVVQRLQDSDAHVIAAGAAQQYSPEGPDPDQLNLVLDALDEAYAHIVVVGPHDAARLLFEAIEGRFDAGITVSDGKRRVTVIQDPPGTFLGYEVADIEIIRYERKDSGALAGQRIIRTGISGTGRSSGLIVNAQGKAQSLHERRTGQPSAFQLFTHHADDR